MRSLVAASVCLLTVALPLPAGADPAQPTNYRSEVHEVRPSLEGLDVSVVGGDSFLAVRVDPGHELVVLGYRDEPYVRIDAGGRVWQNRNSPAAYLNEDRYGEVPVPAEADPEGAPDWEWVGSGHSWAWHDHRIHWMAPVPPPQAQRGGAADVFSWEVPLILDGAPVVVEGRLKWLPDHQPFPAVLAALGSLLPLAWVRRSQRLAVGATATLAGLVATWSAIGRWLVNPSAARGFPVAAAFVLVAVALGAAGSLLGRRPVLAMRLVAVSGALLVGWSYGEVESLTRPVVPSLNPLWYERLAVAWALVAGTAVVIMVLMAASRRAE